MLTNESQEPVHRLMPSLLTPKQLTRFSWPTREPTFSPRVTSQTCPNVSLHSKTTAMGSHVPCTRNHRSLQTGDDQKRTWRRR